MEVEIVEKRETVYVDVKNCARCGGDHKRLQFDSLNNPPDEWNRWALCPVASQPILLRIVEDDEEDWSFELRDLSLNAIRKIFHWPEEDKPLEGEGLRSS